MPTWFEQATRFADPAGAVRIGHFVEALGRFPVGHLVDLGCGHGIFARAAADLGWRVTAVDARAGRFPADPRVEWVTADVREYPGTEDADVIACLGLWYHLTLDDQRALAARCAPHPLLLDTHVALADRAGHVVHHVRLGSLLERDGYCGRLYHETGRVSRRRRPGGTSTRSGRPERPWSVSCGRRATTSSTRSRPGWRRTGLRGRPLPGRRRRARLDEVVTRYGAVRRPGGVAAAARCRPAAAFTVAGPRRPGARSLRSRRRALAARLRRRD